MRGGVPECGRHGDGCQGNEGPLSDWGGWKIVCHKNLLNNSESFPWGIKFVILQ